MFGNIGMGELLVILVLALLLFGAKRLPEIAKGIGKAVRFFREGVRDITSDIHVPTTKGGSKKNG